MNFQIRIRTDDTFNNIDYVKQWLDETREGFAFEHNKSDNHHFHLYLFGLERNADAMRRHLGKYLEKQCYSVSTSANKKGGKKIEITKELAWQYASAPKSNPVNVWCKLPDHLRDMYVACAEEYYKKKEKGEEPKLCYVTEKVTEIKSDKTWEKLMEGLLYDKNKYDGKTIPEIKSMIAVSYLRELRAMPRPSDLYRYSTSLYYIVKHGLHLKEKGDIPDHALVPEFNNGSY